MEYSMEMYQAAKNIGALMKQKNREEYDSLWKEEEAKEENPDPMEVADNVEVGTNGPEIVDVQETISSISESE